MIDLSITATEDFNVYSSSFTLEFYVKFGLTDTSGSQKNILDFSVTGVDALRGSQNNSTLKVYVNSGDDANTTISASLGHLSTSRFYYILITGSLLIKLDHTVKLYVDTDERGTISSRVGQSNANLSLTIGSSVSNDGYFNGNIDKDYDFTKGIVRSTENHLRPLKPDEHINYYYILKVKMIQTNH